MSQDQQETRYQAHIFGHLQEQTCESMIYVRMHCILIELQVFCKYLTS